MTVHEAIIELREHVPAAARQMELACELLGSDDVSIELVVCLAIMAGKANSELTSIGAALEGLTTHMQETNRKIAATEQ